MLAMSLLNGVEQAELAKHNKRKSKLSNIRARWRGYKKAS